MSSNDGTGLREALRDLRSFEYRRGDLIHQRDLGAKCMCAKCIESRADAALSAVAPPPVLERDGHVIRHVVEDGSRSEVIWRDGIRPPGKGSHIYLHPEHAARLAASPAAPAQPGVEGWVLVPRDVLRTEAERLRYRATETCGLGPDTTDAGAQMVATAEALERLAASPAAPAQQAVTDEMRLNWLLARCTVDWSGVSIPCGLSRAGDPAESRAAIDAALASNAAASAALTRPASAQQAVTDAIQRELAALTPPDKMTESRAEYWKAGARACIAAVNRALASNAAAKAAEGLCVVSSPSGPGTPSP